MNVKTKTPERLARLSEICLALPRATREDKGQHASFSVSKKPFAWFLNDHHGDGIVGVACKVLPGENTSLIDANPRRFCLPAYIGHRGWVTLRLDLPSIDWPEVKELVRTSYVQIAPKTLTRSLKL